MTAPECALPGCFKPRCLRPGLTPPLTCSNHHHDLLMATRLHPEPYISILRRNNAGLCALFSCAEPPHEAGHPWCSLHHYLEWLAHFTSSLHSEHRICALPGCARHVYVDEDGSPPSRFCGWRHKQKSVRLSALQRDQQEALCVSVKATSTTQQRSASMHQPTSSNESKGGHMPLLNSRLRSLKQFVLLGTRPKDSSVCEGFYEMHPSEVFKEGGHACWLIGCPKFTSKGSRQMTTKGSYHWKQSGKPVKKSSYTKKFYTYTERKGKEKQDDDNQGHHAESSYTMHEYMLENITSHSLIHLIKEKKLSSDGKFGKEPPCTIYQVDHASVQDTVTMSDPHDGHGCSDLHGSCQSGSADFDLSMFGDGIDEAAQVGLDIFSHEEGLCFPLVFPELEVPEFLQGGALHT